MIAVFAVQLCSFSLPSYAKDGDGERQNVLQRTMQYSRGVDLVEVGRQVRSDWVRPRGETAHGATIEGMEKNCRGFTVSECGIPCCGKRECELVCTANNTIAHGDEMCLSSVQTSECGMSCCGEEDCANVCLNYRVTGDCGGYTKTPDGQKCCGYEDCRAKACGSYTSVTTVSGQKEACCGKDNCEKVRCEYQLKTTGQWGGTQGLSCCGKNECYEKECSGQTSVDSRIHPEKKDLPCCGAENCNLTACDGYVSIQSPSGLVSCCGYEDCHAKECNGYTHTISVSGKEYACCGQKDCYVKSCDFLTETDDGFAACCGYDNCVDLNIKLCENSNYICYRLGGPYSDGGETAEYSDRMNTITFYSLGALTHVSVFGFASQEEANSASFRLKKYTPAYGGKKAYTNLFCTRVGATGSGETGIPKGVYAVSVYQAKDCGWITKENNGIYEIEIKTMYGTRGYKMIFNL